MASNADRNTPTRERSDFALSCTASTTYFAGTVVCVDTATGLAVPGATSLTRRARGIVIRTVVAGAVPTEPVEYRRGCFRLKNSTAGDLIAAKDIGANCFMVDNDTVALTNGGSTRSVCGVIEDVDAAGVWVSI